MKYRITINGAAPGGRCPSAAAKGRTVKVKIPIATDVNMHVSSADADLKAHRADNDFLVYSFIMPPHDVDIRVTVKGSMLNTAGMTITAESAGVLGAVMSKMSRKTETDGEKVTGSSSERE